VVYLRTLCPTVYQGDSGEILTTMATLGVGHPTGFPLYILAGHLAMVLVPFGESALGANLLSALCAAGAVALLAGAMTTLGLSRAAAGGAALFLAFSATLWSHATVARVYAMAAFFLAALLWTAAVWCRDAAAAGARGPFLFLGVLFGLALGTHASVALFFPAFLLLLLATDRRVLSEAGPWRAFALSLLIGGSLYLYLPIAASRHPEMNWGNPSSPGAFLSYVTQVDYGAEREPRTLSLFVDYAGETGSLFFREFTPLGFLLAVAGLVVMARRRRAWFLFSAFMVAANVLLTFFFLHAKDFFLLFRYFFPSYLVLAVAVGFGLQGLLDLVARTARATAGGRMRAAVPRAAAGFVLLLPVLPLAAHFTENDRSHNTIVRDYGANVLLSVPEDGILLSVGDQVSGALWYLRLAEGKRPDVVHLETNLLTFDWYCRTVRALHPDVVPEDILDVPAPERVHHVIEANMTARPVLSTLHYPGRYEHNPIGLVVALTPLGSPMPEDFVEETNKKLWPRYAMDGLLDERVHKDAMVQEIVRFYSRAYNNLGVFESQHGRDEEAIADFGKALEYYPDNLASLVALGNLHEERGEDDLAAAYRERAMGVRSRRETGPGTGPGEEGPLYSSAPPGSPESEAMIAFRKGMELGQKGDAEGAAEAFQHSIELSPENLQAYLNLGTSYMILNRVDEAIKAYQKAVELDPGPASATAYLNLGLIYANVKGDLHAARENLQHYLDFHPKGERAQAVREEVMRLGYLIQQEDFLGGSKGTPGDSS
jgi:Flp pilus assembly protein TadD